MTKKIVQIVCFLLASINMVTQAIHEPNPPNWDTNKVKIMDLEQPEENQKIVTQIWEELGGFTKNQTDRGQFSSSRYVIMFRAGTHPTNVPVGYYTQVIGLGEKPTDTKIANLWVDNGSENHSPGALDNFWRGAENLMVNTPTSPDIPEGNNTMTWAVSQAVSLRRIHINGNLNIFQIASDGQAGWASGGFMADVKVDGFVNSGPQQQWLTRNAEMSSWKGANWNLVFSGVKGAPATHCGRGNGTGPYTTLWKTDFIAEKPYIVEKGGKFVLKIPKFEKDKVGTTSNNWNFADEVDFGWVFVAHENNTADEINAKLEAGLRVVFQPGIYNLTDSIQVNREGAVLLGLGLATLVPQTGKPCIEVADVDNVRIAGLVLQAGPVKSYQLLRWGIRKDYGNPNKPGVMSDVYVRAGGPDDQKVTPTSVGTMVVINRGGTLIDNTWLWRADHDINGLVMNGSAASDVGIVVNGDNVTAYGLMSEHHLTNLVEWRGNFGKVVMYQSEYPYDVDSSYADMDYVSYYVEEEVTHHQGYGIGTYSNFRDHPVVVKNGIKVPPYDGIKMINSLSVFLNGNEKSGIEHVISGQGMSVNKTTEMVQWVCYYDPSMNNGGEAPKSPTINFDKNISVSENGNHTFIQ